MYFPVCHNHLPTKWTEKTSQIHLLSVARPIHAVGDQFEIYMLQHFNIHVAELMKIAKRKTSIDSKHSLNTLSNNREHHRNVDE